MTRLLLLLMLVSGSVQLLPPWPRQCEPVAIPMCDDMSYNFTTMPNLVGDDTQDQAVMRIKGFEMLLLTECSPHTKTFLCLMFAPVCKELSNVIVVVPPCRSMCLEVRSGCESTINAVDLPWPEMLSCDTLPTPAENLCFEPARISEPADSLCKTDVNNNVDNSPTRHFNVNPNTETVLCPDRFIFVDRLDLQEGNGNGSCAPRCDVDVMYRREDKRVMAVWMLVWSLVCFVCCAFAILTYCTDQDRLEYPFRPVVFMSFCYAVYSFACMLPAMLGPRALACERSAEGREFLVQKSLKQPWCLVVFIALYYFGMAGSAWWVVLAVAWFLIAGRRWSPEAVEELSGHFHCAAWAVPAFQTAVVLILRSVDGDELTGLCYVSPMDTVVYTTLVIVPLISYLVVSVPLILLGFSCLPPVLTRLRQEGKECSGLKNVMGKVALHTVIYLISTLYLIVCHVYEVSGFHQWLSVAMATPCAVQEYCSLNFQVSSVNVFTVKTFMAVAMGIGNAISVSDYGAFQSWRQVFSRCCTRKTRGRYVV